MRLRLEREVKATLPTLDRGYQHWIGADVSPLQTPIRSL